MYKSIAQNFIGQEVSIFCKQCKKRMMSVIDDEGKVHCPICCDTPKGKNVSLAMGERRNLINAFFTKDRDLEQYISDSMERFCQGLDDMESGKLSKAGALNFYDYYGNEFSVLDDCALYYLKSPDNPDASVFSNSELDRMNYREDRKINCFHYDAFKSQTDGKGEGLADLVEAIAYDYRQENFVQCYDPSFSIKEFAEPLTDLKEKQIVYLLYAGYSKTEIQTILNVTEGRLRTMISNIAKHLQTPLVENNRVKVCSCCHQAKIALDFGKDGRKSDGLQSKCKACDKLRKKPKSLQEKQQKLA